LHIHKGQEIIAKNIIFLEAELFAIQYDINHATQLQDIPYIVIITDVIPITNSRP